MVASIIVVASFFCHLFGKELFWPLVEGVKSCFRAHETSVSIMTYDTISYHKEIYVNRDDGTPIISLGNIMSLNLVDTVF